VNVNIDFTISRKLKGKTYFKDDWITDEKNPEWASWLRRHPSDNTVAVCLLCQKTSKGIIELNNMGRSAIKSHSNGAKHKKIVQELKSQHTVTAFIRKDVPQPGNFILLE
jgi:hypothetical protein